MLMDEFSHYRSNINVMIVFWSLWNTEGKEWGERVEEKEKRTKVKREGEGGGWKEKGERKGITEGGKQELITWMK